MALRSFAAEVATIVDDGAAVEAPPTAYIATNSCEQASHETFRSLSCLTPFFALGPCKELDSDSRNGNDNADDNDNDNGDDIDNSDDNDSDNDDDGDDGNDNDSDES